MWLARKFPIIWWESLIAQHITMTLEERALPGKQDNVQRRWLFDRRHWLTVLPAMNIGHSFGLCHWPNIIDSTCFRSKWCTLNICSSWFVPQLFNRGLAGRYSQCWRLVVMLEQLPNQCMECRMYPNRKQQFCCNNKYLSHHAFNYLSPLVQHLLAIQSYLGYPTPSISGKNVR